MLTLQGTNCPWCRGIDLRRYSAQAENTQAPVSLVECRACEVAWQWPIPRTEQDSFAEFRGDYEQKKEGTYYDPLKREAIAQMEREFVESLAPRRGRLLDVGCGDGQFVTTMAKAGWDATGLDPALPAPTSEAAGTGRRRLLAALITELPPDERFDVVTLWDVVEHLVTPDEVLREAAGRVAQGGLLVIETGNYQCASRFARNWWNYQNDHRWYLAPPQLRRLMTEVGLHDIKLAPRVLRPWWKGSADVARPSELSMLRSILRRPWAGGSILDRHRHLLRASEWKGWGGLDIMTMTGRKV